MDKSTQKQKICSNQFSIWAANENLRSPLSKKLNSTLSDLTARKIKIIVKSLLIEHFAMFYMDEYTL